MEDINITALERAANIHNLLLTYQAALDALLFTYARKEVLSKKPTKSNHLHAGNMRFFIISLPFKISGSKPEISR
jgi:hypothetical protein